MNRINNFSNSGNGQKKESKIQRETKLIRSSFNKALSPQDEYLGVIRTIIAKIEQNDRVLNLEKKLLLQSCRLFQEQFGYERLEEEFGREKLQDLINKLQDELKEKAKISKKAYQEALERWNSDNEIQ